MVQPVPVSNAGPLLSVQTHSVHLIHIGDGAVLVSNLIRRKLLLVMLVTNYYANKTYSVYSVSHRPPTSEVQFNTSH